MSQPNPLSHLPFLQNAPSRVSVVIPTLNEVNNLVHVLPKIPEWVHEVVLVDGRSVDGTVEQACKLWPNCHIVREERRRHHQSRGKYPRDRRSGGVTLRLVHEQRPGKGIALRRGFEEATGDLIVMLDADGSTAPEEIPAFVAALLTGADVAKGSRFLQGGGTADMPFHRKLGNSYLTWLVRVLFGGSYTDLCYGYNAFWKRVLPQLHLDRDGFEIETLMNIRALEANLRIKEVPSYEYRRIYGKGNLKALPDGMRVLKTILGEWFKAKAAVRQPAPAWVKSRPEA